MVELRVLRVLVELDARHVVVLLDLGIARHHIGGLNHLVEVDLVHVPILVLVLLVLFSFKLHARLASLLSHFLVAIDSHGVPLSVDLRRAYQTKPVELALGDGLALELGVHHFHCLVCLVSEALVVVLDASVPFQGQHLQTLDVVDHFVSFEEVVEDVYAVVGDLVELLPVLRKPRLEALVHDDLH